MAGFRAGGQVLVSLVDEAEGRLPDVVADAREQGYTWHQIAGRLATSVTSAQRRYAACSRFRASLRLDGD